MRESAILFWSNETDQAHAAPGDAARLRAQNLNQRVVRVIARDGEWTDIAFGALRFRVRAECLRPIEGIAFDAGDAVAVNGVPASVRDIIWHFRDGVANFYLERDGKKLSKRYLASDLTGAS